jgi:phytoene desaturase
VNGTITSDLVLSGADYHHTETLLDKNFALTQKNIGTVEFLLLHLYCSMLVLIKIENISHHALFLMWIFISMQKIFMMPQWQKSLCFTLISLFN